MWEAKTQGISPFQSYHTAQMLHLFEMHISHVHCWHNFILTLGFGQEILPTGWQG